MKLKQRQRLRDRDLRLRQKLKQKDSDLKPRLKQKPRGNVLRSKSLKKKR